MGSKSRRQWKKLISVPLYEQPEEERRFDLCRMPRPKISIDARVFRPVREDLPIACALDQIAAGMSAEVDPDLACRAAQLSRISTVYNGTSDGTGPDFDGAEDPRAQA
jgi:hypothetical protein